MNNLPNTNFSNDGSFMEQFLQNYSKTSSIPPIPKKDKLESFDEKNKREEARRLEAAKKRKEERDQIEIEQKKREEMVQKMIEEQKKKEESTSNTKAIPKARKQPFISNTKPTITGKRKNPPRTTIAMPKLKKQKIVVYLPRNKSRRMPTISAPKAPPGQIKVNIDKFAEIVVNNGIQYEKQALLTHKGDPIYSFLLDKDSDLYKYYEYKKEQLCEANGIILERNVNESKSVKIMEETVKIVSKKYKNLEKELEEEDKTRRARMEEEALLAEVEAKGPESKIDNKFMKKLSSHFQNKESIPDDKEEQGIENSNLVTESNKGFLLMKSMGWKEGTGLGSTNVGRVNPVIADQVKLNTVGLGVEEDKKNSGDIFSEYQQHIRSKFRQRPPGSRF